MLYCYNREQQELKRQTEAQAKRDAHAQRIQEAKQQQEIAFPSDKFAEFDPKGTDDPDIKGTVLLPDRQNKAVTVVGYALRISADDGKVLLVLRPSEDSLTHDNPDYMTVLCDSTFLPTNIPLNLKSSDRKMKTTDWEKTELETVQLKRADQDLYFVTSETFYNRTCDSAMYESLKEGLVLVRKSKRKEYLAFSLPFAEGTCRQPSEVYELSHAGGAMCLTHPGRQSDVSQRILSLAKETKNDCYSATSNTMNGILKAMEHFSSIAEAAGTNRSRCLNVALGGAPSFGDYGRFVPCSEQSNHMPFPNGSFTATPCSCDIMMPSTLSKNIKDTLKKMKGPNSGHNSRAKSAKKG